jgi:hypothetical protein
MSLSTQRQSSARPEVRLQTTMVGTLDETRTEDEQLTVDTPFGEGKRPA